MGVLVNGLEHLVQDITWVAIQHVLQHTPGTNVVHYNASWVNPTRPALASSDDGSESDPVTLGDSYAGGRGRYYVESGRSAASGLQLP